jgi:hypothetical protein
MHSEKSAISLSLKKVLFRPKARIVYGSLSPKVGQSLICIVYRARNDFNSYDRDIAEYHGQKLMAGTLGPEGFGTFGSHCESVQRGWNRALKHGWADFSDEHKTAPAKEAR